MAWLHAPQQHVLKHSPTLRFVVLGSVLYTLVSLQGSHEAVPFFNRLVHFTQYKVAHAHLGLYGFYSMIMFGSIYFVIHGCSSESGRIPS